MSSKTQQDTVKVRFLDIVYPEEDNVEEDPDYETEEDEEDSTDDYDTESSEDEDEDDVVVVLKD